MVGTRPGRVRKDKAIGQLLQAAREMRGLSIADCAAALTISPQQLIGLEEGELTVFTAEVYARGAFAKYAAYVGVAPGLTRQFQQLLSGARTLVPLRVLTPRSWLSRVLTPRWLFIAVGALVASSIGGYIAWQVQSFWRLPQVTLLSPTLSRFTEPQIAVRGRANANATVTVNGQAVLLQPDGTFAAPLFLRPGVNTLAIEAVNAAGRKRILHQDLLLSRQPR